MTHPESVARRMFDLVEPIALVNFFADEPNEAMAALGFTHATGTATSPGVPPRSVACRRRSSTPRSTTSAPARPLATSRRSGRRPRRRPRTPPGNGGASPHSSGSSATSSARPELSRAADLLTRAAVSAPVEGRVMYAALRALPIPDEPVARLWHAANMLREHRGDGHIAALMAEQIDRTECHVLLALDQGIHPAETFGRIHHLPKPYLASVMAGLRDRGLVDGSGHFTDAGRATKDRIEAMTDRLAEAPYAALDAGRARRAGRRAGADRRAPDGPAWALPG